jgi:type I restriction enzyme R subunit
LQQVFEARVRLAEAALVAQNQSAFHLAISLIAKDLASLPEKSIAVREKWKEVKTLSRPEMLQQFEAATKAALLQDVAPLMQWVNITGHEQAYQFDRLVCQLQIEKLKGSAKFDDYKDELIADVSELRINLTQVAVKVPVIDRVKTAQFWTNCTVEDLEEIRTELRGVMKYRLLSGVPGLPPKVIDVREDVSLIERKHHRVELDGLDLVAYRNRVLKVLTDLFATNDTLRKIKAGEPVDGQDLEDLCSLVLTQEPGLDLRDLTEYYPESAGHLDQAIRGIIGLDAQAVHDRFTRFVHQHPGLASHQVKFLDLLQNHISQYGAIAIERLYEPPFTILDSDGLDGVFPDESLAQELLSVIDSFRPQPGQEGPA